MSRFVINCCVGIFVVALCSLVVLSSPYAQQFMFNSDQLTIPSFADDYLINPIFSVTSWMIPRAPYLFPDLLVYSILRMILRDSYIAVVASLLLYLVFVIVAARLILKRAFSDPGKANLAWYSFLALSALTLAAPQAEKAAPQFDASLMMQLFLPITHGTAAVSAVIAFCLYERVACSRSLLAHVAFLLLSALAVFSDKLYAIFFALPYVLGVLLASPNAEGLRRASVFAVSFCLSFLLAAYLDTFFTQQTMDPLAFPIWDRIAVMIDVFETSPTGFIILFGGCVSAIYLGVRLLQSLPRRDKAMASETRAQAFIVLMTGAGLAVGLLLWQTTDPSYARYMVGMQMGGLLATAFWIASWQRGFTAHFVLAASVGLAAIFLVGSLRPASVLNPFAERTRIANGLNACRERLGLQGGYAQYWLARKLSVMTNWNFQINQFHPGYPAPFFWGSNISWYYYRLRDGQPLVSNFIIEDGLQRNDILHLYGEPFAEADCGDLHVLVYEDANELQRRVYASLGDSYALEKLTRHFPSDFSQITTVLGPYKMSAFARQVGLLKGDSATAMSPRDAAGFLMFGPYLKLPAGNYRLEVDFTCLDNSTANSFDVTTELGSRVLQRVELPGGDARCDGGLQKLSMPFDLETEEANVEFRAFFGGTGRFDIRNVNLGAASK